MMSTIEYDEPIQTGTIREAHVMINTTAQDQLLDKGLARINQLRADRGLDPREDWVPGQRDVGYRACLVGRTLGTNPVHAGKVCDTDPVICAVEVLFEDGDLPYLEDGQSERRGLAAALA